MWLNRQWPQQEKEEDLELAGGGLRKTSWRNKARAEPWRYPAAPRTKEASIEMQENRLALGRGPVMLAACTERHTYGEREEMVEEGGALQGISPTVEGVYFLTRLQNTSMLIVHTRFMSYQIIPEINWRQKKLSTKPAYLSWKMLRAEEIRSRKTGRREQM